MTGWTSKPRKAGVGCLGCGQQRGDVIQALSARLSRVGSMWLCAGCATSRDHRQAFIDEYANRVIPLAVPAKRRDELA